MLGATGRSRTGALGRGLTLLTSCGRLKISVSSIFLISASCSASCGDGVDIERARSGQRADSERAGSPARGGRSATWRTAEKRAPDMADETWKADEEGRIVSAIGTRAAEMYQLGRLKAHMVALAALWGGVFQACKSCSAGNSTAKVGHPLNLVEEMARLWARWAPLLLALPIASAFIPASSPLLRLSPSRAAVRPAEIRSRAFRVNPRRGPALWMVDDDAGPYDAVDAAGLPPPPAAGQSHETDIVVIGSGLGGLSAGALLVRPVPRPRG